MNNLKMQKKEIERAGEIENARLGMRNINMFYQVDKSLAKINVSVLKVLDKCRALMCKHHGIILDGNSELA